jgi:hypothetical protein
LKKGDQKNLGITALEGCSVIGVVRVIILV